MTEQEETTVGETLWLIAYDVESEHGIGLKPEQKDWLRSERVAIWYTLRYTHKCVPIQRSLWLIRQPEMKAKLEELKEHWLADYKKGGFFARIEIFPITTNDVGYKTFKAWEFDFIMEWLGKIEKALIKAQDTGKIGKKNVQAHMKKLQLLNNIMDEDFDDTYPNWKMAQDTLAIVEDTLHKVQYGD